MTKQDARNIKTLRTRIAPILRSSGVRRASLFGSAARGEMRKNSDVDILVDIPKTVGLFEFVAIKLKLEEALGRKVDLVEYGAMKAALKRDILKDGVSVL